ncbi:MAG: hypothetical protein OSB75_05875, partial [Dehalococcoidia bacterium]|nr:hypothetical protein [Dehalococcoidia bacterium]
MKKPLVILFAMMSAVMLLAIACGSDEADPTATATPAPPATVPAGDRAPEPTAAPTAVPATKAPAPVGGGDSATLDIDVKGDALQ